MNFGNLEDVKTFNGRKTINLAKKIDLLVEEVRKLTLEIEYLSTKYQLFHKDLEDMQQCEVHR